MGIGQDDFQRAKERYDDAREAARENYERMREDLRFSNPAAPDQWNGKTRKDREGRPTLTLDQTNQFIQQVVNDGRQNTPSIQTVPVDSRGDVLVAQQINGMLRHTEYVSRAAIAYDTSLEYSARIGLGWLRVVPVVVNSEKNYQEPRVFAVNDPLSCCLDGDSVEFDGSDAMFGFAETVMTERGFKRKWPKAKPMSFASAQDWCTEKGVRVAEYFDVIENKVSKLEVEDGNGGTLLMTEDEYWDARKRTGLPMPVRPERVESIARKVMWRQMSGVEFLDETEFPAEWIGLVPVYGHVLWVDGKRYICGLTRRLMDGQRLHNYGMSSLAEQLLEQPKAPFLASARAVEGYEDHWKQLNKGNPAYLVWNDVTDDENNPIAPPQRLAPPAFPVAAANLAQLGVGEMQASVGMFKSVLGQQSNAISGKAKIADKIEGDTATFHYVDNQRRSLEHLGRILVQMQAKLIDTARTVRVMGVEQDKTTFVRVDPDMDEPVRKEGGKVVAINLNHGRYDVRVKVGPSYTTMREELQQRLTELGQSNPPLAAALAPLLVKMADMPDADRIARVCMALLPPVVQQAYNDDENVDIPPAVKAQMQSMQQQLQQATELITKLSAELDAANNDAGLKQEQAQADIDFKDRELGLRERELDLKEAEAAARIDGQAAGDAGAAAAAETAEQVQQLVGAIAHLIDSQEATAQQAVQALDGVAALGDQLAQLTDFVSRPRVAQIEYDGDGRPVRAVGTLTH